MWTARARDRDESVGFALLRDLDPAVTTPIRELNAADKG
jgi:hypothetical protein